jgi:hypothetical protein
MNGVNMKMNMTCLITISRPINGISINGSEYLLDGDTGEAIKFSTVKEALGYLAARNYSPRDLLDVDFNVKQNYSMEE